MRVTASSASDAWCWFTDSTNRAGAKWAGQHYQAGSTKVIAVGTMDLRFGDETHVGTMTAVVNGQTLVNPLARFAF